MKRLALSVLMLLVLLGCVPTYQIVARSESETGITVERDRAPLVKSWEQTRISARPLSPSETPSWIRRNLTVFEVTLENLASEELLVRLDQFALVDSKQVQRSPIPAEDLDQVADRYSYPPPRFVFGFGLSSGHYHPRRRHFGYGYHYYDGFPLYVRRDAAYLRALHDGPVVPRSQKRGWLFFDRVEEYPGNQLDLYYLVDGKIRLVFPFEVIQRP